MVSPVPLQPKPAKMGLVGFCWSTERKKILEGVGKRFPADVLHVGSKTSSFLQRIKCLTASTVFGNKQHGIMSNQDTDSLSGPIMALCTGSSHRHHVPEERAN